MKTKLIYTAIAVVIVILVLLDAKIARADEVNPAAATPPTPIVSVPAPESAPIVKKKVFKKKIDNHLKLIDSFATKMQNEYQFDKDELKQTLLETPPLQKILASLKKQKKQGPQETPEEIAFRFERRVNNGVKFWAEHKDALARAQSEYGVDQEIIVALLGIETNYGTFLGEFKVFDTLVTLAFYGDNRPKYFEEELQYFLVASRTLNWDVKDIVGSNRGAIGIPQFMPRAILSLAVDCDGDNDNNINHPDDAVCSAANFLTQRGWERNQPIATLTSTKQGKKTFISRVLPGPYKTIWKKEANYYNLMHYNPDDNYVMSIFILSQKIKERYADYLEILKHTDELKLPSPEVEVLQVEPSKEEVPTP